MSNSLTRAYCSLIISRTSLSINYKVLNVGDAENKYSISQPELTVLNTACSTGPHPCFGTTSNQPDEKDRKQEIRNDRERNASRIGWCVIRICKINPIKNRICWKDLLARSVL